MSWLRFWRRIAIDPGYEAPSTLAKLYGLLASHPLLMKLLSPRRESVKHHQTWRLVLNLLVDHGDSKLAIVHCTPTVLSYLFDYAQHASGGSSRRDHWSISERVLAHHSESNLSERAEFAFSMMKMLDRANEDPDWDGCRFWAFVINHWFRAEDRAIWQRRLQIKTIRRINSRIRKLGYAYDALSEILNVLASHKQSAQVEQAFLANPERFVNNAITVMVLPNQAREVTERWLSHPLLEIAHEQTDPIEVATFLSNHIWAYQERCPQPIPKRLKRHLTRESLCEAKVVQRDLVTMKAALGGAFLAIFEDESERIQHALTRTSQFQYDTLMMGTMAEENQRTFRRLLNSTGSPVRLREKVLSHPVSQEWITEKKQAFPDWEAHWFTFRIDSHLNEKPVTIQIEQDPEEVLRMGTYAQSCLALGAFNSYSAVANLIDVNKQVINMRDADGRLLARRLVAMSEEGELVFFSIYTSGKESVFRPLFDHFARALSQRTGISIYNQDSAHGYTIKKILSQSWYDDGACGVTTKRPRSRRKIEAS